MLSGKPFSTSKKTCVSIPSLDHLYLPHGGFVQVYSGVITDTDADNIENYFYDLPTAMKRRNRYVVPDSDGDGLRIANPPHPPSTGRLERLPRHVHLPQ